VKSPPMKILPSPIAIDRTRPLVCQLEAAVDLTTAALAAHIARAAGHTVQLAGNIGVPALDLLEAGVELYILELSSFQLETTESLSLAAATVLNVTPDHLDRYPDLSAYAAAKARILEWKIQLQSPPQRHPEL